MAGFDLGLFTRALREEDQLFARFSQRLPAASLEELPYYYAALPLRGAARSQCAVWRRYLSLAAEQAGDSAAAVAAGAFSDDAVVAVLVERGHVSGDEL